VEFERHRRRAVKNSQKALGIAYGNPAHSNSVSSHGSDSSAPIAAWKPQSPSPTAQRRPPPHIAENMAEAATLRPQQLGNTPDKARIPRDAWASAQNGKSNQRRPQERQELLQEEVDLSELLLRQFRGVVLKRGSGALHGLSKLLREKEGKPNGKPLEAARLQMVLGQFGISLRSKDADILCAAASRDDSYSASVTDFLKAMYGPISSIRQCWIDDAWDIVDRGNTGTASLDIMIAAFEPSGHPEVALGRLALGDAEQDLLAQFRGAASGDGLVAKREFFEYYASVSAAIQDDHMFEFVVKHSWPRVNPGRNVQATGPGRPAKANNVLVTFNNGQQRVIALEKDLGKEVHNEDTVKRQLKRQGVTGVVACVPTG